jgi:hypothetical protein
MVSPHYPRHRVLSNGKHYTNSISFADWTGNSGISYYDQYYESIRAEMTDCINPIGPRGFRAPGPCTSYKVSRSGSVGVSWRDSDAGGWDDYVLTYDPSHYDLQQIVSYLPEVPASIVADNRVATASKLLTQIPTVVQVANFLWESRELKASIDHYKKAVTRHGVLKIGKKKAVISDGLKLQDVPGWANATFLDVSFNLLPMVSDLWKMTQLYSIIAARLEFLRKNRGKPTRQTFINSNLWSENPYVGTVLRTDYHTPPFGFPINLPSSEYYMGKNWDGSTFGAGPYGNTQLTIEAFTATYAGVWTLIQELDGLDDAWATLRALIAGTGFNNPAKIIWNAIPFSFIVDWMFPFGDLLDRLAVQPFSGRWDVYDVTNSVHEKWVLHQVRNYNGGLAGIQSFTNPVVVERYSRVLGLDFNIDDLDFTDFTKQQQSLLASLAAGLTLFRHGRKS